MSHSDSRSLIALSWASASAGTLNDFVSAGSSILTFTMFKTYNENVAKINYSNVFDYSISSTTLSASATVSLL